ncbi:MAG TPA: TIGR03621 family F420-dependent LLM class oxidoreductase [Ilumatobacter sp.]|nr:TIGR03621 family F420-dependent LLM class oxidoreductase [Ilumatobacter sp.]
MTSQLPSQPPPPAHRTRPFRFGVTMKNARSIEDWRQRTRKAEDLGYSTLFLGDHIRNQWGPLVSLTAAADATKTLRVATNVLNNDFRNPVVLAQEIATLDVVSQGRLEFGLGAGYSAADYEATGITLDSAGARIERMHEALKIMKMYWRDGVANFEGEHFHVAGAVGSPRPFSPPWPPICIGGGGKRVLTVAGAEADIVSLSPRLPPGGMGPAAIASARPAAFAERLEWVREAAGTRFSQIELHLSVLWGAVGKPAADELTQRLAREFGLTEREVKALPVVLAGSVNEVCESLTELREVFGINYFSFANADMFAPVVAKLAGRPTTVRNFVADVKKPVRATLRTVKRRVVQRGRGVDEGPQPRHSVLMIGAGGMGEKWIRKYLPRFDARCSIDALVDVLPMPLKQQGDLLGVPIERRFDSIEAAFRAVQDGNLEGVDACFVVVPPAFHHEAVEGAVACGLDVLCEKPMADTWEDCVATYKAVRSAGVKMQVVQNYRYARHIQAAMSVVGSGVIGPMNYVMCRFASDYRVRNSWGAPFRHQMRHALLLEAASHHLDQARYLVGSDFAMVHAMDWKPASSTGFDGECCALVMGRFENDVRYCFEGSVVGASQQNSWGDELYRLECADGAVVVGDKGVAIARQGNRGLYTEDVPLPLVPFPGHAGVIKQFFDWLDGGVEADASLDDNIATAAAVFASIESARSGCGVDVRQLVSPLRS